MVGDAGRTDLYRDAVPANIVLVGGVYGSITTGDIEATIGLLPQLFAPGAAVIWTRGRRDSTADLIPAMREWFARTGFTQRDLHSSPAGFTVGRHDDARPAQPLAGGQSMFTFHGFDRLSATTVGAPAPVGATPR